MITADCADKPACSGEEGGDEEGNGVAVFVLLASRKPESKVGVPDQPDCIEAGEYGGGGKGRFVGVDVVCCWLSHCDGLRVSESGLPSYTEYGSEWVRTEK